MFIRQRECHSYYRDVHYCVIIILCHAPTAAFLLATTPLDATKKLKRLLQLRFDFDSASIRLRFDFYLTRQCGHHNSMLMKTRIHTRQHFASEAGERAIPTSTIEGCYPMLIRQRECHSYLILLPEYRDVHYYVIICPDHCLLYWLRRLSTRRKMNMFIFRRSRIEAESKSNRSRIAIVIAA